MGEEKKTQIGVIGREIPAEVANIGKKKRKFGRVIRQKQQDPPGPAWQNKGLGPKNQEGGKNTTRKNKRAPRGRG